MEEKGKLDVDKLSSNEQRIFEILGEHKIREEQLTKMIHSQAVEIKVLKKKVSELENRLKKHSDKSDAHDENYILLNKYLPE